MPVTVSLQVFSGRENPRWELDPTQIQELKDRLKGITATSLERPPGMLGGLGYQGFTLSAERELDLEPSIFVHAGLVDLGSSSATLQAEGAELERWLLSTSGDAVGPALRGYVEEQLQPPLLAGRGAALRALALEVPRFEPSVWNSDDNVRLHNNCYNYSNNKLTNTFAQPGRGSGQVFARLVGAEVARAVVRDGIEALARRDTPAETPIEGHFIALVIWPALPGESEGTDYHFYRLDETTRWSHKPGQTAARDVDSSGRQISDPATCDRGPYTEFVGYFHSFPDRIRIR